MPSWTFQPAINPYVIVIAIVLLVTLLLVRPAFANLTSKQYLRLILLRCGIILMAAVALLRPGCVQQVEQPQSGVLSILLDESRSMELPHRADDSTRWNALKDMIADNQARFEKLREQRVDVRFYGFSADVQSFADDGDPELPADPDGSETDIGTAVYKVSQEVRGERLLGVFLASDGVQNATDPDVEISQAASTLNDLQVPLYAVAFGLPGDTGQVADVAVTSLPEQHRIAVKNELGVNATVVARGYANQELTVQLIVTDSDGIDRVVDTEVIRPNEASEQRQVSLSFVPTEPGQFRMRVRAEPQPGEVATRNNELPSFLTVYEGGVRILFLSGNPIWWEQRELRNALRRAAQGFEIVFESIGMDENSRATWPVGGQITQRLQDQTFDVIILGDVDSEALWSPDYTANMEAILRAIDDGKGFMMLGGYHSFGPGKYHSTPLADILPIEMDPTERQDFPPAPLRKDLHLSGELNLVPSRQSYITSLPGDRDPVQAWRDLTLKGANRFLGVKPQAEILLETDGGRPILVSGRLGGRVLAFAADSTWRWVLKGHRDDHNAFWRQTILWLARKDGQQDDTVWIDLPQRRYQPKSFIEFTAGVGSGNDQRDYEMQATLVKPNKSEVPLTITRDGGLDRGELDRELVGIPGLYEIRVTGKRQGREFGRASAEFVVFDRDTEKANSSADPEQMKRLASQTESHGGRLVLPEELGQVLDEIINNPQELRVEVPLTWRLGETATDGLIFLVVFVALLTVEWYFRKKWGLV